MLSFLHTVRQRVPVSAAASSVRCFHNSLAPGKRLRAAAIPVGKPEKEFDYVDTFNKLVDLIDRTERPADLTCSFLYVPGRLSNVDNVFFFLAAFGVPMEYQSFRRNSVRLIH
jgi:hypothetical protein